MDAKYTKNSFISISVRHNLDEIGTNTKYTMLPATYGGIDPC